MRRRGHCVDVQRLMAAVMEKFATDWLALREPHDADSRSRPLARAFLRALPRAARIADLGCGRGANACYLASCGRRDLRWLLVDGDDGLLAQARRRLIRAETLCAGLSHPRVLAALQHCHGVTASALCDLASGVWIDGLVRAAARSRLPLLLALSVDGRVTFSPDDAGDQEVLTAFRKDQRRDKGLGPALGASAPLGIARSLRRHGFTFCIARSDWRLGAEAGDMLQALMAGFSIAAPVAGDAWLRRWQDRRRERRVSVAVGHVDILAIPRPVRRG